MEPYRELPNAPARIIVEEREPLTIAFESGQVTYSEHDVDLYNSGVNFILSASAARGHTLFHFSMTDVTAHDGTIGAIATKLVLPERRTHETPYVYQDLKRAERVFLPFERIDLYFIRGDDIKPSTPNVEALATLERESVGLESLAGTLDTCDKYEVVRRCTDAPQPATYKADTLEEALDAIRIVPQTDGRFVLKDRFGYGCGKQVHLVSARDPQLEPSLVQYLSEYKHIIIQEFVPAVREGDLVSTFFDGVHLGTMKRIPAPGEWKANASLGSREEHHAPSEQQVTIARSVATCFDVRLCSIDLFPSGAVIEINAFPGGEGLYRTHDVDIGSVVLETMEPEAHAARVRRIREGDMR